MLSNQEHLAQVMEQVRSGEPVDFEKERATQTLMVAQIGADFVEEMLEIEEQAQTRYAELSEETRLAFQRHFEGDLKASLGVNGDG